MNIYFSKKKKKNTFWMGHRLSSSKERTNKAL